MFLTTHVKVCVSHADTYLPSYHWTKRLGGELTKGRNVHKSLRYGCGRLVSRKKRQW